jgi:hypothetical protein
VIPSVSHRSDAYRTVARHRPEQVWQLDVSEYRLPPVPLASRWDRRLLVRARAPMALVTVANHRDAISAELAHAEAKRLAGQAYAKARGATLRRDLIDVAARTARHGRGHITVHLHEGWHRQAEWMNLFEAACRPPPGPGGLTSPDTGHRALEQPTVATRPLSPNPEDHAQAAAEARGQATMPGLTW